MLLNSEQILKEEIIIPSEFSNITQVGIDLSVRKIERIDGGGIILKNKTLINPTYYIDLPIEEQNVTFNDEKLNFRGWFLLPGEYVVHFNEKIKLPLDRTGIVVHRSSLYRQGGYINSPLWDPLYQSGENTMSTVMHINWAIFIEENARLAQCYILSNQEVSKGYDGQWRDGRAY